MRLLHLQNENINQYLVIDKIVGIEVFYEKNLSTYSVHIKTINNVIPIALKTKEPDKVVKDLLTIINTIDNEIIEYTIKEEI